MDIDVLREVSTVLSFLCFLGIVAYAASPRNRERFERAGRMIVDDDEIACATLAPGASPAAGAESGSGLREAEHP